MKRLISLAAVVAIALLSGCASLQTAGIAEYTVKPIVIDKQTVCCEVSVKNGKEYASLKASIKKTGDDYSVELEEQTVMAFTGQSTAAGAVKTAVESAATLGATAIGGSAAGAVIQAIVP